MTLRYEIEITTAAKLLQDVLPVGQVKAIGLLEVAAGIRQLQSQLAAEQEKNKRLRELLAAALPNIECTNSNQSGLITAIGEYLEGLAEGEDNG